jgi:hypothetical protein
LTQTEILQRLNVALAAKGLKPISKGAFSRHSVKMVTVRAGSRMPQSGGHRHCKGGMRWPRVGRKLSGGPTVGGGAFPLWK